MTFKTNYCVQLLYLRGQDGWRHLVAKVGLGRDLGMGATSALCYAAATHHRVYILSREGKDNEALLFVFRCKDKSSLIQHHVMTFFSKFLLFQ